MKATFQNTNAATRRTVITIRVVTVDPARGTCTYRNYHEQNGKVWSFRAWLSSDVELLKTLEVNKGYSVIQFVDQFNKTHWSDSLPYDGKLRLGVNEIIQRIDKKKADRKEGAKILADRMDNFGIEF